VVADGPHVTRLPFKTAAVTLVSPSLSAFMFHRWVVWLPM